MSDVESDLRARVEAFAGELRALVRRQALSALAEILEPNPRPAPRQRARSRSDLERITGALAAHISASPGQTVEQISKTLAAPSKDLARPLRVLLAAQKITSRGQKRATRYFPRAGRGPGGVPQRDG